MPARGRPHNRLLVLCTSINDVTAWPFWKFLQMKKIKGVTDMALLAFNSEGGSFEARIDGDKYSMKNYEKVRGYKQEMFLSFLDRWYDPGRSYFVYGGHGMGDYLEFEQYKFGLQAHELAGLLDKKRFEAILFDACFMANLDCAYYLRNNTRYIGACEGYMWEPDTALDYHIFNTFTASAMSRFREPRLILETIQREYTSKAPRGDFAVLDTTHAAELRQFVADHVMQRVYNHATLYNTPQQERLTHCAERAVEDSVRLFGQPGGESHLPGLLARKLPSSAPTTPDVFALANAGRLSRRQRVAAAIQFEHSIYPSEPLDKHLVDLKSYLTDMALEEDAAEATSGSTPRRRPVRKAAAGAFSHSRAYDVDAHGSLPEARVPRPHGAVIATAASSAVLPDSTTSAFSSSAKHGRHHAVGNRDDDAARKIGITSVHPQDSARYGLELFDRVVVSHVPPRSGGIYASHLGGLSVAVHEYSAMSKPTEPWKVSKTILNKKVKSFLAKGALDEVRMKRSPLASMPAPSSLVEATEDASNPFTVAIAPLAAAGGCAFTPVSPAVHSTGRASGGSCNSGGSSGHNSGILSPPFLSVSSSAYSPLSARSRFYASFSCAAGAHHHHQHQHLSAADGNQSCRSCPSLSSSIRSDGTSSTARSRDVGRGRVVDTVPVGSQQQQQLLQPAVMRCRSADDVVGVQRMATEAAQLLDTTNRC